MLDFLDFNVKTLNKSVVLDTSFKINTRVKDIMTQGKQLYAVWDFQNKCWTKNKDRVCELIDACIDEYIHDEIEKTGNDRVMNGVRILWATDGDSGVVDKLVRYAREQKQQNFRPLDTKVVFKSDPAERNMYSSHRLPYDPLDVETPYYDRLMSVLYSDEERQKIEWLVGAGLAGDNDKIQKFGVLYGEPGTGKGTVLDIIAMLFQGYTASFEADALGRKGDSFALEPFKDHPVIAIQTDGNLSRIEDNARLNTLIAHERLTVNEKYKGKYDTKFDTILFIGTNEPVKITNAKSGLLRRLIDISPTGDTIPKDEYDEIKEKIPFELSGIAFKCRELYLNHKKLYNAYRPMTMMAQTNEFYDFILEYYDQFCAEEYILLSTAWTWYKKYVEDANAYTKLSRKNFATELSVYFVEGQHDEWYTDENGNRKHLSSVYRGFKKEKFKNVRNKGVEVVSRKKKDISSESTGASISDSKEETKSDIFKGLPKWLKLTDVRSTEPGQEYDISKNPLNVYFSDAKAQYAVPNDSGEGTRPKKSWDNSRTKLSSLDTREEHYVLTQEKDPNCIFVDFDKKDPKTGKKSLRLNLEAAKAFPKTYAETSKSGQGLHLYYIYDGDPSDLSMLYDTDIEIKVMKGKSALRRKLILCNNEDISHISSGLPLKENKHMVNWDGVENEKHLRALINKGLKRQVFPNTKPSIDYIAKVLDDAYQSGIFYDVNDLRPKVMNFAAGSTNNAEYCMSKVCEMPFMSEDASENNETKGYLEKPIAFFDWEVFPNLSILCYKIEGGTVGMDGKKEVVKLINPTPNEVSYFFANYRAIGFHNLEYDNDISYGRILGMTNYELYKLSQAIIKNHKDAGFREAKNMSYTDIYDFANTKQSLKKWEIELDLHHQEFSLRWDQDVPEDRWDDAADYCANDVVATEVVFYHLKGDWEARQVLAKLSGLTVNDKTNAHSCRIIFGKNKNPQGDFNYPNLADEFPGYEYSAFGIDKERYNVREDGKSVMTSGKSIFMGDDPSEGGYVYFETGIHTNVALLDIASLHPTTIEVLQLFGPVYTARFSEIKAARIAIKHKDWETARGYLEGALVPFLEGVESLSDDEQQSISDSLSYAFKIVINSVYGLTSAKFPNPCKDPRNVDNVVAKRGALFMILLKNEVQKKGFTVCHVKTDSIKIANATPDIIDFVSEFGKKYGYSFEHEATYDKMCLFNKSVYIAKYDEFGERTKKGKHANQWTATGAECQHPYIFKTLFSHEPIEFKDYCETKTVAGGAAIYLDMNEDLVCGLEDELYSLTEDLNNATKGKMDIRRQIKETKEKIESIHNLAFVGRCGSFVPVERGCGGGHMYRVEDDGKMGAISGTKGYRWLEAEDILERGITDKIDKVYFRNLIDSTYAHIAEYGDAEWFING